MRTHFDFMKKQGGFSLAELLIYIGIVGIVAGLMTGIVSTITKTQVEESAQNEVTGQLNFAMQTIQRLVRESSLIDLAAGTATSTLTLRMKTPSQDPTRIYLSSGRIYIQQGAGGAQAITSDSVVADALEFKKFTQYPAKDVVQIDLALSNATQASGRTVSRSLRSAISRVSAATFDSDLLPGADNAYDIGIAPSPRWQDAMFSGRVGIGVSSMSGNNELDVSGEVAIGTYAGTNAPTNGLLVSGNVGIGTTTPGEKLEVAGNVRLNQTSGNVYTSYRTNGGAAGIIGWDTTAQAFVVAGASNSLTDPGIALKSGGSVGIGTTTPMSSVKLTVVQSASGDWEGVQIRSTLASGRAPVLNFINQDTFSNSISLSNINNFAIAPGGGNVGIGTTTPTTAGLVISTNVSGVGIDVNNHRIQNVALPLNDNDAATKAYVDAAGGGGLSVYKSDGVTLLGKYAGVIDFCTHMSSGQQELECNLNTINYNDFVMYISSSSNTLSVMRTLDSTVGTPQTWYYSLANCTGNLYSGFISETGSFDRDGNGCLRRFLKNYNQVAYKDDQWDGSYCRFYQSMSTPYQSRRVDNGTCTNATGTTGLYTGLAGPYPRICGTGTCIIK